METTARVDATLVITGELRAQEDVAFAGRIEGTIHIAGHTLTVQAGGHVQGDIRAHRIVSIADGAVIRGRIEMPAAKKRELSLAS